MKNLILYLFTLSLFSFSCNPSKSNIDGTCNPKKITFNLNNFDERGLLRVDDMKNPIDYEFCVPNSIEVLNTIAEIDSSIKPLKGKGRTKCADGYIILIGNSYNKDIKTILCKLSKLEYITEINQVFWE